MPNTSLMQWAYPSDNDRDWYSKFVSLVSAQDAAGYASREDRSIIMGGGGTVSFTASTGVLEWDAQMDVFSPNTGYKMTIAIGNVTLLDGQTFYINLVRNTTQSVAVTANVASGIPNTNSAFAIAVRSGNTVYFRHGLAIADGESSELWGGGGGGGGGPVDLAVVFDGGGGDGPPTNIRSNRELYQSQIDNDAFGIVNLGAQFGDIDPDATGAIANRSTIGGGTDHSVIGEGGTVVGGQGNTAGTNAVVGGVDNTANGDNSVAFGAANNASAPGAVALGAGSTASGNNAFAIGSGPTAGGSNSMAVGSSASATANNSIAIGAGASASVESAVAVGPGASAEAEGAVAIGTGVVASGDTAVAMGVGAVASGIGAVALGSGNTAGPLSFVANAGTATSAGAYAAAFGYRSKATRSTQVALSSGRFAADGDAQTSIITMLGSTPGSGSGETAELVFADANGTLNQNLILEDDCAYTIVVSAVAYGEVSAAQNVQSFRRLFSVRKSGGTTVIAASGTLEQIGDAASSSWTLTASVEATPDRFALTFSTGSTTSAARVVAKVEFTEVLIAP